MSTALIFAASCLIIRILIKNAHYLVYIFLAKEQRNYLHGYYSSKFNFYAQLSAKKQLKFLYRVSVIKKTNRIKVADRIKHVNDDIELMVSAAFTQITFGFTNYELRRFSKIILYPDSFYSKLAGAQVNGLTVGNGYIYLSWNHFLKGYRDSSDKVNLALHELAHALYIDKFHKEGSMVWYAWEEEASLVFNQISTNNEIDFFRPYAKTNMEEFWAVTVECFFEDPANFKSQFPALYQATAKLLKQDLLEKK